MKRIVDILKKGGIGVLATDTIYGVVGSANSKKAVDRIYKLKGRDEKKPFIILISDVKDLEKFGISTPSFLITKNPPLKRGINSRGFWPLKTTIIFPITKKYQKKLEYLHRGTNSLAFRLITNKLEKNKNLFNIIKKVGPIVAPSANPQGLTPAQNINETNNYFGDKINFYLDSGNIKSKPSKIIFYVSGKKVVIRK